jgi:hypothetical protein
MLIALVALIVFIYGTSVACVALPQDYSYNESITMANGSVVTTTFHHTKSISVTNIVIGALLVVISFPVMMSFLNHYFKSCTKK